MEFRLKTVKLDKSAGPFRRSLQYAFYDWTSEMLPYRRAYFLDPNGNELGLHSNE